MFRKITCFSLVLLALIFLKTYDSHARVRLSHQTQYQNLMRSSQKLRPKNILEREPAHQIRRLVQKDIWLPTHGGIPHSRYRSHIRIKGQTSDLSLQHRGTFEITEQLQSIEYCRQEQQEVQWLNAREGTYWYPLHQLEARDVELFFFPVQDQDAPLPESMPSGPCSMHIAAETAECTVHECLHLSGNVRLFKRLEKPSFALADELTYDPKEKTLRLRSNGAQKVLFWQDDLRMSARELCIQKHRSSPISVQGIGDVRFAFDMEEEQTFQSVFGKWL